MIPKIIHYCWFGRNPLPELAVMCIESWKKYFPDYEIKEWNEDNFDVNIIPYTAEAYQAKKFAFVSDYARFWILYHYGGLYFDTDVEVIRPMDNIVNQGSFMGCEKDASIKEGSIPSVAPGLGLGCENKHPLYAEILDEYANLHFVDNSGNLNLKTVVEYVTEVLCMHGLRSISGIQCVDGIFIYPKEYFCPIDFETKERIDTINTYTVHHYAASWHGRKEKIQRFLLHTIGKNNIKKLMSLWKK